MDALFEDLGKECGELNMLMPTEGAGMGCPINTGTSEWRIVIFDL